MKNIRAFGYFCFLIIFFSSQYASSQDNIFPNILGSMLQQQALIQWQTVSKSNQQCIDAELRKQGYSLQTIINQGILPQDQRLIPIKKYCSNVASSQNTQKEPENNNLSSVIPDGRYLTSESDCQKLNTDENAEFDNMLTVKGNEISGYEFGCTVKSAKIQSNSAAISGDCGGEGENWKIKTNIKSDGKTYNFGKIPDAGAISNGNKPSKDYYYCGVQGTVPKAAGTSVQTDNKNKKINLGSHCGSTAQITNIVGFDSKNAIFQSAMNNEQALDSCTCDAPTPATALKGKKLDACMQNELKKTYQASADCELGTIIDTNNHVRKFTGKLKDGSFELAESGTGEKVENASYSGYDITINEFSILCPKKTCIGNTASSLLDGCKP